MIILAVGAGLVGVAGLGSILYRGRKARKRAAAAAAEAATHPHYCAECDEEWPHAGQTCLYSWATVCSTCAGALALGAVAPMESRA